MNRLNKLDVFYHNRPVGTMALYQNRLAAFEYDSDWIRDGFSIAPFSLPLEKKVFIPKIDPFEGLFGVFADSLPDGWGRLLFDRLMRKNGFNPQMIGSLERLAIVGASGMGALTYRPVFARENVYDEMTLDEVAKECGLKMEEVRLFHSERTEGYFGIRRFDRVGEGENGKIHMVSAAGLLETSHRIPNLDYDILMKLTLQLTKSMEECEKLYRQMCFNVFAHNRDDHSKNFTYIYKEEEEQWVLSPAYDLTYSNSFGGEHATTVNGNGWNPGMDDILAVAKKIGLNIAKARKTAAGIKECVYDMLGDYIK